MTGTADDCFRHRYVPDWEQIPPGRQRSEAADVTVGDSDQVFVLTRHPGAVLVYDSGGRFCRSFGDGVLSPRPHAVTIGADGRCYVVDEPRHVIRVFSAAGQLLDTIGQPDAGSDTGVDESLPVPSWPLSVRRGGPPFNHPTKAAPSPDGGLYVSDGYGNARVHHFGSDGSLVRSWGGPGTGPGQFNLPHSVLVLADGRVVVADRENDRLSVFVPGGSLIAEWTSVRRPCAVTQDDRGLLFVAELPWQAGETAPRRGPVRRASAASIAVLSAAGRLLARWTPAATGGPAALTAPHGICTDPAGSLYLAEVCFSYTGRAGPPGVRKFAAAR